MESLQILLCLICFLLIIFWPRSEHFAYAIMWLGWLFLMFLYLGHTAGSVLSSINL